MYIPTIILPEGTKDGVFNLVLRWVSDLLAQIGHLIAEGYPKALEWLVSVGQVANEHWHLIPEGCAKALEWLVSVGQVANEPLKQHPYAALFFSLLIFIGPWILLLPLFLLQAFFFVVLYILGFGLSGIIGGSPAALYQSFCHGGHTPANSIFAMLQSTGTHYNVSTASNLLVVIRIAAGVLGGYVLFAIILA